MVALLVRAPKLATCVALPFRFVSRPSHRRVSTVSGQVESEREQDGRRRAESASLGLVERRAAESATSDNRHIVGSLYFFPPVCGEVLQGRPARPFAGALPALHSSGGEARGQEQQSGETLTERKKGGRFARTGADSPIASSQPCSSLPHALSFLLAMWASWRNMA